MSKTLDSLGNQKNYSARRSQRRINKLLDKNISEYSIPNPYRNSRANAHLPRNLTKQLSRMDYFSVKTLQNLHFAQPTLRDEMNELLVKMKVAVQRQSQQLTTYLAAMSIKLKKYSEKTAVQDQAREAGEKSVEDLNDSLFMPKSSQNSIEIFIDQEQQQNLLLASQQSECVSMMEDNYEADKLIFPTNGHLLNQIDEPIQFYEG